MALILDPHQNAFYNARRDDGEQIYTFREVTEDQEPVIPAPQIFQSLLDPSTGKSSGHANIVSTVAECAAHLELLETFHELKAKLLGFRELGSVLGIESYPEFYLSTRTVDRSHFHRGGYYEDYRDVEIKKIRYRISAARRREKWLFFLRLAVVRFEAWL